MRFQTGFVFIVLVTSTVVAQQVPNLINYQGKLTNSAGQPLPNGTYTLTFRIYNQAQGGTIVWGPQLFDGLAGAGHSAQVPVADGFFNVMLGPIDTSSRSILAAFDQSERYLEIAVSTNPPMAPRQKILSAPYAIQAMQAPLPKIQHLALNAEYSGNHNGPAVDLPGLKTTNFPIRKGSWLRARMVLLVRATSGVINSDWCIYVGETPIGPSTKCYDVGREGGGGSGLQETVVMERLIAPSTLGNTTSDKVVTVSGRCQSTGNGQLNIFPGNGTLELEEVLATQIVNP